MTVLEFIAVMGAPFYLLIGIPSLIEWITEKRR